MNYKDIVELQIALECTVGEAMIMADSGYTADSDDAVSILYEAREQAETTLEYFENQDNPQREEGEAFQDKFDMYMNEY
jgi:hypothetical protein